MRSGNWIDKAVSMRPHGLIGPGQRTSTASRLLLPHTPQLLVV
jgi:hypothetical protein